MVPSENMNVALVHAVGGLILTVGALGAAALVLFLPGESRRSMPVVPYAEPVQPPPEAPAVPVVPPDDEGGLDAMIRKFIIQGPPDT